MKRIDSKLLKRFAVLASERLTGDWIIVGGTVLPLLGADHRVTIDVDVVSAARDISQAQTLVLMEIAQELGLPVEAVNSAASFYLHQISDHRAHWVEFAKGPRATIYRPDLVLFFALKTKRMSQADLEDCLEFLKVEKNPDVQGAAKVIQRALKQKNASKQQVSRLKQLLAVLED